MWLQIRPDRPVSGSKLFAKAITRRDQQGVFPCVCYTFSLLEKGLFHRADKVERRKDKEKKRKKKELEEKEKEKEKEKEVVVEVWRFLNPPATKGMGAIGISFVCQFVTLSCLLHTS